MTSVLQDLQLQIQRAEELSNMREEANKKALDELETRQTQKLQESESRLQQLVHQDIEASLQAQANATERQSLRSALLAKIEQAKIMYDESHAELLTEMTLLDEITGDDADARSDRREVNKNIVRKRTTLAQKTQVLLAARAQLQAQGAELALDVNRLLTEYNV